MAKIAAPNDQDQPRENHNGAAVQRFLESMPIFAHYGARVVGFTAGASELELLWRRELTFDGATIQAGVSAALMDFAGGSAAATLLPAGWGIMTTGYEVHNTAPALGERLIALGQAIHMGKRTGLARADVFVEQHGERTLCASGLVTTQAVAP
ncbi:MAG: PaaI family thioesterase [Rhodospirillaceae bacterium]|jgi:uncharacterized protein (TIGR00369 family)|nr:PaaI family thioesterase [Rhodospirillaceae bacterium]MBT5192387.1 PaaI family thioesterase [Rhodospirillaceae bacterium]MBT5897124.1 PaaI family thioesterase [Rhodospirillaceae bacterium]MBT7756985.1 PaaI family thioesterase [Rhodospirillaceae bacterium]